MRADPFAIARSRVIVLRMSMVEQFVADLSHGARWLRRHRRLAVLSTLIIAIGVGGSTAIFSVADAVVLRPLPYAQADRLFVIQEHDRPRDTRGPASYPAFADWRNGSRSFEAFAAATAERLEVTLTGQGEPAVIATAAVSGEFFELLGVQPIVGRALQPYDDQSGAAAAVLSYSLWRERFDADPAAVGRAILLEGRPHTIVGIMPSHFAYPDSVEVWLAMRAEEPLLSAAIADRLFEDIGAGVGWLTVIGRLRHDVSLEAARDELTGMWRRMYRRSLAGIDTSAVKPGVIDSFIDGHGAAPLAMTDDVLGPVRPSVLAVLAASLLLLLITCANVAGLLLTTSIERRREFSMRQALGASRSRLVRAAFVETLLLAMLGAMTGLLVAWWATPMLGLLTASELPRTDQIAMNARVVGFAALATVLVTIVAAVSPLILVRRGTVESLIHGASDRVVERRGKARPILVVSEVALAVVLLAGAGLMMRTFVSLREVPLGFEVDSVLTVELAPRRERYAPGPLLRRFYEELLGRVRALPGVESAAVVTRHPLWSTQGYDWPFTIEGQPDQDAWRNPPIHLLAVSHDYFTTLGMRLLAGRGFTDADREGQPGVVLVSESFARRAWPGAAAVGKRLKMPLPNTPYSQQWLTVIGVVADARYRELERARLDVYVSHLQAAIPLSSLMVRTRVDPATVTSALREAVRVMDPNVPVVAAMRMSDVVTARLARRRFTAQLFATFALAALTLAVLGLYALLAHAVASRTREIGIRLAMGARPADIRREITRWGLGLTGVGLLFGLSTALAGGPVIESLLYGVDARDPLTLTAAPLALLAAATVGCALPAARASRVNPAIVLRDE
ncbi:MAG: ABC transporter permease [Vicinamibacterales bacterium]